MAAKPSVVNKRGQQAWPASVAKMTWRAISGQVREEKP